MLSCAKPSTVVVADFEEPFLFLDPPSPRFITGASTTNIAQLGAPTSATTPRCTSAAGRLVLRWLRSAPQRCLSSAKVHGVALAIRALPYMDTWGPDE